MTTIDSLLLLSAALAGVVVGLLFFGSLWWTVRRGLASPRPALWLAGGLAARMALALGGLFVIASGDWRRLLLGLAGFVVGRVLVTRLTRPRAEAQPCA